MASPSRRPLLRQPDVVDTGCSHRRSKLSSFFSCSALQKHGLPKTPISYAPSATTSTSQCDFSHDAPTTYHSSSFGDSPSPWPSLSPSPVNPLENSRREKQQGIAERRSVIEKMGGVEESVEVVMESKNPHLDFRNSMMTMIVEKEIYRWDDLQELLHRYLSLNSPYHHPQILRAFAEALNILFSSTAAAGDSSGQLELLKSVIRRA